MLAAKAMALAGRCELGAWQKMQKEDVRIVRWIVFAWFWYCFNMFYAYTKCGGAFQLWGSGWILSLDRPASPGQSRMLRVEYKARFPPVPCLSATSTTPGAALRLVQPWWYGCLDPVRRVCQHPQRGWALSEVKIGAFLETRDTNSIKSFVHFNIF